MPSDLATALREGLIRAALPYSTDSRLDTALKEFVRDVLGVESDEQEAVMLDEQERNDRAWAVK